MNELLRIFIGWDSKEPLAWSVCAHSILRRATRPVSIVPLTRISIGHVYTRPTGPKESTEFSISRFMVPFLSEFNGYSIFMDCDFLCRVDIGDVMLHVLANPRKAVYCCQHEYVPKASTKFLGQQQTTYPRKNWTSLIVFDNARCTALTPDYVNTATGLELHRLQWLPDDQIGSLPLTWNWLVGEYEPNPDVNMWHYTNGSPCFPDYAACDHATEWWAEYADMLKPAQAVASALQAVRR